MVPTTGAAHDASMTTAMSDPAPPPPPPPAPPRPRRRLYRSRDDRMLGGVAGGIAETYGFDPSLVRVVMAAVGVITAGTAIIAYLSAWAVIPESDGRVLAAEIGERARHHRRHGDRAPWLGIALVVAGLFALGGSWHTGVGRLLGPLALIVIGAAVLLYRHDRPDVTPPTPAPTDVAPPVVATAGSTASTAAPDDTSAASTTSANDTQPWPTGFAPPRPPIVAPAPRPPRERSILGRLTLSALLLLAGTAWLVDVTGAAHVDIGFVLSLALGLVGIALVVSAWVGRAMGLIALALVLTLACAVVVGVDVPLSSGIGERIYRPQSSADVRSRYELGIGHLVVDLSKAAPPKVVVRDGIGEEEIIVPANADVTVHARLDAGALRIDGRPEDSGWHVRDTVHLEGTGPHIDVDARVGFGRLVVVRAEEVVPQ